MARYFARPCPRCNGYLGIVLREPGRNTPLQAINGQCVQCGHRLAWTLIRGKARRANQPLRKSYARPTKQTREREALLRRLGEIEVELAQIERNIREIESRLSIEEQLRLKLRRFIDANIPELTGKVKVEIR